MGGSGLQLVQRVLSPARAARAPGRRYEAARRRGTLGGRARHRTRPTGAFLTDTADITLTALMVAAQAGDARAYQALLRACVPAAAAAARRQGVPAERIEDVVQDVLLTIHRVRATYDPARPFLPWLRAIAARRAIDALRHHYRRAAEIQDEDATALAEADAQSADDALDGAERAGRLKAAIATLPPGQRQAVELLALRERTLEQAAGETGRSKVALKVNLHRGIAALRRRMAEPGDV